MHKRLRIKDIAKLAGVSPGTVDRVIHNRGEVSEENRLTILKIIQEHNYKPNLVARSLATKRSYLFVSLLPEFGSANDYWNAPDEGIIRATQEVNDFNVTVRRLNFDQYKVSSFREKVEEILALNPDGVILSPVFKADTVEFVGKLDKKGIPYVFIDSTIEGLNNLSYLGQNSTQSGYLAAKLLNYTLPANSNILIVRSSGLEHSNQSICREEGVRNFFKSDSKGQHIRYVELDPTNPQKFINALDTDKLNGIVVVSSRAYEVAQVLEQINHSNIYMIGYDLLPENITYLKKGVITFLIAQRPEEQGYRGILTLFNSLVLKESAEKNNYLPIDILSLENIDYYLNYL